MWTQVLGIGGHCIDKPLCHLYSWELTLREPHINPLKADAPPSADPKQQAKIVYRKCFKGKMTSHLGPPAALRSIPVET